VYQHDSIGKAIAAVIIGYAPKYLGVDVHVGKIDVRLLTGRAVIHDFEVGNPQAPHKYHAPYLFKAHEVVIDIDMKQLLCSCGSEIVVEEFKLVKIDAIIEYDGYNNMTSTTNVQTVLDFMSKKGEGETSQDAPKVPEPTEEKTAGAKRKISVRKVQLSDIGVKIANKFGRVANDFSKTMMGMDAADGIAGVRVAAPDMQWENLSEQKGSLSTVDVLDIIIRGLLKTILANTVGLGLAEKLF
jgi:hypothetical protein